MKKLIGLFLLSFTVQLFGFDSHKNFAWSTVATAPSPANSGTSLTVASGEGSRFPAVPFDAAIYPRNSSPSPANAEIVRVTAVSSDTLTITRAQESTSARSVLVGDVISAGLTVKSLTDVEDTLGRYWTNYTVFTDTFSDLSNWTSEGDAGVFNASSGLTVKGNANTFKNYLHYKNWVTAARNWTMTVKMKFATTNASGDYGLGVGIRSANSASDVNAYMQFSAASGSYGNTAYWHGSATSPNVDGGTSTNAESFSPFALADTLDLVVKRRDLIIWATISNETTHAVSTFAQSLDSRTANGATNGLSPASGYPALWAAGGTQTVSSVSFSVDWVAPCNVLLVGDSITDGEGASFPGFGWAYLFASQVPGTVISAAEADRFGEWLLRTNEMAIFQPRDVVFFGGGNDIQFSTATDTWKTNLLNAVAAVTATRSKWVVLPSPWSTVDVTPVVTFIRANYPSSFIDCYSPFTLTSAWNARSDYISSDGIHPSDRAHSQISTLILNTIRSQGH